MTCPNLNSAKPKFKSLRAYYKRSKDVATVSLSPDIIEQIRERTTLSEIVSETVQLKRSGRNLLGLCPFHGEKTPSFSVNDEEGFYHCFGCGKGGSAFDFIMELRGYSFREAAKFLASRAGIEIPEHQLGSDAKENKDREARRELGNVLAAATDIFHKTLTQQPAGEVARAYLAKRQIKPESIAAYRVGFAPSSWEFLVGELTKVLFLGRTPTTEETGKLNQQLVSLGLIKAREKKDEKKEGGYYDAFRGRVMFPISRSDGCTIAFGGRILQDTPDTPKYINSSENPLYAKRRTFYGLSQSLPHIRKARHVFVVEGYLDVIGLTQAGVGNTLATCGTAMTEGHVQIVKRFVDRVSLLFDGDAAGQKAAARCFPLFLNSGIEVSAVVLPAGEDPDSLARNMNAEELHKVFSAGTKPIVDMFIDSLIDEVGDVDESSAAVAGKLASRFASAIAAVQNPVEQEFLLKRGAERFGVSFEAMKKLLSKRPSSSFRPRSGPPINEPPQVVERKPAADVDQTPRTPTIVPSAAAHRNVTPVSSARRDSYAIFLRQLVVAVVCEPLLATSLRQVLDSLMPSDALRDVNGETRENGAELRRLSPSIRNFIDEIVVSGLSAGIAETTEDAAERHGEHWKGLLERHGFSADELITEARRQIRIGGTEPWRLVEEAAEVVERHTLIRQVKTLRSEEASGSEPANLLDLVQQKLKARRALDDLKRAKSGRT